LVKFTLAFIAITLLLGCTSKQESDLMQAYDKKTSYRKRLQKTEKIQLYDGNMTKAMLTATYLYTQNFKKKDTRDEVFIVGIHLEDDDFDDIREGDYSLTLNGHSAKEALRLDLDDERLIENSFVTEWGSYYLVSFPHVESKDFTLVFKSAAYGEGMLHFAKVAKYVLSKQAF